MAGDVSITMRSARDTFLIEKDQPEFPRCIWLSMTRPPFPPHALSAPGITRPLVLTVLARDHGTTQIRGMRRSLRKAQFKPAISSFHWHHGTAPKTASGQRGDTRWR